MKWKPIFVPKRLALLGCSFVVLLLAVAALPSAEAQGVTDFDKARGRSMLKVIKDDLKNNYYDTKYHGMDLEARFKAAEQKMDQAQSLGQVSGLSRKC